MSKPTLREIFNTDRTELNAPVIDIAIPRMVDMGIDVDAPCDEIQQEHLLLAYKIVTHVADELGLINS